MAKFKVGDKARVKYVRGGPLGHRSRWRPNIEVIVISSSFGVEKGGAEYDYTVSFDNNCNSAYVLSDQLEPIIQELSTWEEIQQLTNWNPEKVAV